MNKASKLTYRSISESCGDLPGWKIAAIESTNGTHRDLEVALAWAAGENDVMGKERVPLQDEARAIYQLLVADDEEWRE